MRCPGCGNEIPSWANGVCYTCGRMRREARRYGSHPSARQRAHADSPVPQTPPRVPRGPVTEPPAFIPAEPQPHAGHCPVCGQDVPQDRLEEHMELHRRPAAARRQPGSSQGLLQAAPRRQEPAAPGDAGAAPAAPLDRVRRRGINDLLADIYGRPHLLSDILRDRGVSQADITRLSREGLAGFLQRLLEVWRAAFAGELAPGSWNVIVSSYGLDGAPPVSAEGLAQALGTTKEHVIKLRDAALAALRGRGLRIYLESLAAVVARQHLRNS